MGASRSTTAAQLSLAAADQVAEAEVTLREDLWEEAYRAYLEGATHRVALV